LIDYDEQNWPANAHFGCKRRKDFSFNEFMDIEDALVEDNEKLISNFGFFFEEKKLM
jgi:hypothetical protein